MLYLSLISCPSFVLASPMKSVPSTKCRAAAFKKPAARFLKKKPGSRSHGTKANPTCLICHQEGHNSSRCPQLASKLLAAVRKRANAKQITEYLTKNESASILGMRPKPMKTLKRRSRGFAWNKKKKEAPARKVRKRPAQKRQLCCQKKFRSRPRKESFPTRKTNKTATMAAYSTMKKEGWAWKPKTCLNCGKKLSLCSWKTSQSRGLGRLFYRCKSCGAFRDVLAFSHLLVLRFPLALIWEALCLHFATTPPPSASQLSHMLGCSPSTGGALQSLLRFLLKAEKLCALSFQSQCRLSGLLDMLHHPK